MLSKSVSEPACVCVCCRRRAGGCCCKDIKREKRTFFCSSVHECSDASFSALSHGTKTTVTTHSFPWRAVACGRIGDFSQGYLWHCWSFILTAGPLRRPDPSTRVPRRPTSQKHPSLSIAICLSPPLHLTLSFARFDRSESWWVDVFNGNVQACVQSGEQGKHWFCKASKILIYKLS